LLHLAAYRSTPHSTTNVPPAQLLFKSNSISRLEQMFDKRIFEFNDKDEIAKLRDKMRKSNMKAEHDKRKRAVDPFFEVGDLVLYRPPKGKVFNKKEPKRNPVPCCVIAINESRITIKQNDAIFTRNSSHFTLYDRRQDRRLDIDVSPSSRASRPRNKSTMCDSPGKMTSEIQVKNSQELRRSTRQSNPPDRLTYTHEKKK
jgi:hypothetical protein